MTIQDLNTEQRFITDSILEEVQSVLTNTFDTRRILEIRGKAGSGKSTTTGVLVSELKKIQIFGKSPNIVATTPTHKALAVLKDMIQDDSIPCKTIHSFLKLKIKQNFDTGKHILVQDARKEVDACDILLLDESSMVSSELFDIIQENINKRKIKCVIFIGDLYQLNPVDGMCNPIYSLRNPYELTKIVRQAENNPIIRLADTIRKYIEFQNHIPIIELFDLFGLIKDVEEIQITKDFNTWFRTYTELKQENTLICAFKNVTVSSYNNIARVIHKGTNLDYIIKDEELVFLEAHSEDEEIIHMNNQVVTVKDCKKSFDQERQIHYWTCLDEDNKLFKVVDECSVKTWDYKLKEISKQANLAKGLEKSTLWKYFFSEKEEFQKVSYTYASTIHKSQGSSIDYVFIDLNELLEASRYSNIDDIYRLLYVGITRAKKKIYLYLS